ncbi:M48 family metalloprotease [Ferrimonas sp. YFM]|uniref:M48 family metalloprotease n=1 Tax=Ferrimonas sp. YFM TaxID=3028878 RepID=UPI002572C3D3|nr:M48 family metalloprotease [Ferrimonas sp. YFM]BDY04164.1 hypothetical protein F0521_12050 [Ferrimonas sp. YFM]
MKKLFVLVAGLALVGCKTTLPLVGSSTYETVNGTFLNSTALADAKAKSVKEKAPEEMMVAYRPGADRHLIESRKMDEYLQGVLGKVLAQWPHPLERPIKVKVTANRAFTARAETDTIILSMGLIADIETEDELAFVLAHEASHILLGHQDTNDYFLAQKVVVEKAANVAINAAFLADLEHTKTEKGFRISTKNSEKSQQQMVDAYKTGLTINRLSRDVISSAVSRGQEDEADLLGLDLMVLAGYSPASYQSVLERMGSSQTFSEEQLQEKKQDFQQFVTLATSGEIPEGGSTWETIGYMAANEGTTRLLQWFSDRHNKPEARISDLAHYVKREYRKERRRRQSSDALQALKSDNELNRYWFASEAFRALDKGFVDKAEALARKSLTGSTSRHAYPRFAMYSVRMAQGNKTKAAQNLDLIENWEDASIQTFILASQAYRDLDQLDKADSILTRGEQVVGSRTPFHVDHIALYRKLEDQDKVAAELEGCKGVGTEEIVVQCHQAAGIAYADEKKDDSTLGSLADSVTSLIKL